MNSGVRSVHFDVSRSRPQRSHPPLRYAPMPPAPSLPAAAGADVVSKGTEQPSDASMHMGPVRHEHAIRSRAEKVVWFASEGPPLTAVALPPTIANVGDVYVHKTLGSVQIWLRAASGTWLPIAEQHPHPIITGYVLRLLENGDPRWVTKETFRTYVGRQKKLEQSAYLS
ncbi:uncharacterized protein B0H18DRAFT_125385 [Fomitopsis serialis]|uniref:uncharacterized protein n=1 Tax=Fomitopsis serialis TaxID=139415 RepID=UPI0020079E0F|nr:uncharacterized protein B0H18DRAFT_125385 [Neoantrodia serialis]KAH9914571.1 hypothetical protein B0H18DRAFT_125385 [Neoantrodia serialis]